jgi:hypothetical protein
MARQSPRWFGLRREPRRTPCTPCRTAGISRSRPGMHAWRDTIRDCLSSGRPSLSMHPPIERARGRAGGFPASSLTRTTELHGVGIGWTARE